MWDQTDIEEELAAAYREGFLAESPPVGRLEKTWAEVVRTLLHSIPEGCHGPALLISTSDGISKIDLEQSEVLLGRSEGCGIHLPHRFVSRQHCRLHQKDAQWILEDLGSSNGTLVNGVPCARKLLIGGDILQVGEATILFLSPEADSALDPPE